MVENTIAVLILHPEIHVQFILETPFLYNCPSRNSLSIYIMLFWRFLKYLQPNCLFFSGSYFLPYLLTDNYNNLAPSGTLLPYTAKTIKEKNIKTVKKKCGTKTRVLNILWRTDITQVTKRHFLLWELLTADNTLVALETTEKVIEETVTQKTWQ